MADDSIFTTPPVEKEPAEAEQPSIDVRHEPDPEPSDAEQPDFEVSLAPQSYEVGNETVTHNLEAPVAVSVAGLDALDAADLDEDGRLVLTDSPVTVPAALAAVLEDLPYAKVVQV